MLGEYSITLEKNVIGLARVTRQGLYYLIECLCQFPQKEIYRITVSWGSTKADLGICVPNGTGSGLRTRIPIKQAGEGTPVFLAISRKPVTNEAFYPLDTTQPVTYLSDLRAARLDKRGEILGIVLTDPA